MDCTYVWGDSSVVFYIWTCDLFSLFVTFTAFYNISKNGKFGIHIAKATNEFTKSKNQINAKQHI